MSIHARGGPSLVQARNSNNNDYDNVHHPHPHPHRHQHHLLHARSLPRPSCPETDTLARSTHVALEDRQGSNAVDVVATVDVTIYVDQTGATLSVETFTTDAGYSKTSTASAAPTLSDSRSSSPSTSTTPTPSAVSPSASTTSTTSTPSAAPAPSDLLSSSIGAVFPSSSTSSRPSAAAFPSSSTTSTLPAVPAASDSPSSSPSEPFPSTSTSAPPTTATAFPYFSASSSAVAHTASVFSNSSSITHSLGVNSTSSATFSILSSTRSSLSSTFASSSSTHSSLTSSASGSLTTSHAALATPSASRTGGRGSHNTISGVEVGGAFATGTSTASGPPRTPHSGSSHGLTQAQQKSVIGGVVGGVAGVAIIACLLLLLLKWRKDYSNGIRLTGDTPGALSRGRGLLFGPDGGGGEPGGGGAMAESKAPFAVASTLSSLVGFMRTPSPQQKAQSLSPTGAPGEERGFFRISGKKLTSVLESGGDGYTDPANEALPASRGSGNRDSMFSSDSMYPHDSFSHHDSQAFGAAGLSARPLQLGSPMRPQSGVPILRTGPARTPVEELTAFPPLNSPFGDKRWVGRFNTPPTPPAATAPGMTDVLGRSLVAQDGSRVSHASQHSGGSRFTEAV